MIGLFVVVCFLSIFITMKTIAHKREITRVSSILNKYIKSRDDLFEKTKDELSLKEEESAETIKKWINDMVSLYGKRDLFFSVGLGRFILSPCIKCSVYSNSKLLDRDEINSYSFSIDFSSIKELRSLIETTETELGEKYNERAYEIPINKWLRYRHISKELEHIKDAFKKSFYSYGEPYDRLFYYSVLNNDLSAHRDEFLENVLKSVKYKLGQPYKIEEKTEWEQKSLVIKYYATI